MIALLLALAQVVPNDPWYANWQKGLLQMECPAAWEIAKGEGERIAVLDNGVQLDHPDLKGKLDPGWNAFGQNDDASPPTPTANHGTLTAGVNASTNNGIGVAGVAWASRLVPVRVTDNTGGLLMSSAFNRGLAWCRDRGIRIVACPWVLTWNAAVQPAIKDFYAWGGLVVCGAYNSAVYDSRPGSPYLIVVGQVDGYGASKGSWGPSLDLVAPYSTYSTGLGGKYQGYYGASAASPMVAGVIALTWSANPFLSNVQVEGILRSTAKDLGTPGWDEKYGWGLVNAYRAVKAAKETP